mgnify:CR=1 FL=1
MVWGLAAGVAAIAGLLLAPITFVHANMGFIGLKAFPAAVVGGFGSLPGAIVGGLVIGIVWLATNEPLIFVEVAFANKFDDHVAMGMEALLDVAAAPTPATCCQCATQA